MIFWYKIEINFISLSFVLFGLSALISSLLNGFVNFLLTPILLIVSSFVIYEYCIGNKTCKKLLIYSSFLGVVLFLFLFIYKYRTDLVNLDFSRLGSAFGDENDIALFFAYGALISFYFFMHDKSFYIKLLSIFLFLLFVFCGFSTGSKIFVLILIVTIPLAIFLVLGKRKWWISLILIVVTSLAFYGLLQLPFASTIKARIDSFLASFTGKQVNNESGDISTLDRLMMFECGINMFLRKPLFGYGIWGFANFSSWGGGWSHNNLGESLCNFGLVGTIFFHTGFLYALVQYFKTSNKNRYCLPFLLIVFYIVSMISVALNSQKLYAYIIGVVIAFFRQPSSYFELDFRSLELKLWKKK